MKLAIIGDYDPANKTHIATNNAIEHAKKHLGLAIESEWVATDSIADNFSHVTKNYTGFLISPGSPYRSMDGVLAIIKYARENNVPALGTCGGFQHMVIEFARNVLNIKDAEHAETNPYASNLVINPLSCSLVGQALNINITDKASKVYSIYKSDTVMANYYCNFGLNPQYQAAIDKNGFRIVGADADGEVRILELEDHPFFIGTLFVPQVNSTVEKPNVLITEFVTSCGR